MTTRGDNWKLTDHGDHGVAVTIDGMTTTFGSMEDAQAFLDGHTCYDCGAVGASFGKHHARNCFVAHRNEYKTSKRWQ